MVESQAVTALPHPPALSLGHNRRAAEIDLDPDHRYPLASANSLIIARTDGVLPSLNVCDAGPSIARRSPRSIASRRLRLSRHECGSVHPNILGLR
jgi:hypothetical protein